MQTSPPAAPPLISALNHVAVMTPDLDRFVDFYRGVLGLELVFREETPQMRHAILRSGAQSWLHPVQLLAAAGLDAASAKDKPLRGHLDHIALGAESPEAFAELRRRLVACGASEGGVDDLGAFQSLTFTDPDGLRVELALIVDPALRHFHAPVRRSPADAAGVSVERLTDGARWPAVERLLSEYVPWVMDGLAAAHGIRFPEEEIEMHNAAFAAEAGQLVAGRGRLMLAHLHGRLAGLVALKPIDDGVAEVKRLYVRPAARGHGIGRALLQRVLADARGEGFHTLRLETMSFMTDAHAMYRALGFAEVPPFAQSQAAMSGLVGVVRFMALALQPARQAAVAEALAS